MNYQKPTDINLHIKYRCPNKNCFNEHWLSLQEASIPDFKVVCEYCETVFAPYPIVKVCLYYVKDTTQVINNKNAFSIKEYKKKNKETQENIKQAAPVESIIPETIFETMDQTKARFAETMTELGFNNEKEISEMFEKAYSTCPTTDIKTLFKIAVLEIGETNV